MAKNVDKSTYVSLVVDKFYDDIVPEKDSIQSLDEGFRLFRFNDKNTGKDYILSNIDENVSHSDLICK